jgi:6-pyruvoyltetrahydropterin/6-carboxytetrahydropterin synthase
MMTGEAPPAPDGDAGRFAVRMRKAVHVFSAGHFITLADDLCEPLHGHNWTVAAEVEGPPDPHGMVVDFILLRDELSRIVARLDHRMLLPTDNPRLAVTAASGEVTVRFETWRWVFPEPHCVLLPMVNTTAEHLARWIGLQLFAALSTAGRSPTGVVRLEVDECLGQSAVWEWTPSGLNAR